MVTRRLVLIESVCYINMLYEHEDQKEVRKKAFLSEFHAQGDLFLSKNVFVRTKLNWRYEVIICNGFYNYYLVLEDK